VSGGRSVQSFSARRVRLAGNYRTACTTQHTSDRPSQSATVHTPLAQVTHTTPRSAEVGDMRVATRTVNATDLSMDKAGAAVATRPLTPQVASYRNSGELVKTLPHASREPAITVKGPSNSQEPSQTSRRVRTYLNLSIGLAA